MNKLKIFSVILVFTLFSCTAQDSKKECVVAFYNVENLFDTVDDPLTNDEEFTPAGAYRYTDKVYNRKLHNIATVIEKLGAALVGLAEIENNTVLNGLLAQPELKQHHYKYIWYNSPDPRGIDVALLYDTEQFNVINSKALPVKMKGMLTRDVLYVCGVLAGDTVHLLVNHWPSRGEGVSESKYKRMAAAMVNKKVVDSLVRKNNKSKIIIMGDMNDNPDDETITTTLGARSAKAGVLYNPWLDIYRKGRGTTVYHRHWDHFDQIIISAALMNGSGWQFEKAEIFDADFIRNKNYEDAYPLRSFKGKNWNNGYSDHLPVQLYLHK